MGYSLFRTGSVLRMTVATAQVRDQKEWLTGHRLTGSPSSSLVSSTLVPSSQDSQAPPLETLIHGSWVESDILCVLHKIRRPLSQPGRVTITRSAAWHRGREADFLINR